MVVDRDDPRLDGGEPAHAVGVEAQAADAGSVVHHHHFQQGDLLSGA
jgi:hypothetical protein